MNAEELTQYYTLKEDYRNAMRRIDLRSNFKTIYDDLIDVWTNSTYQKTKPYKNKEPKDVGETGAVVSTFNQDLRKMSDFTFADAIVPTKRLYTVRGWDWWLNPVLKRERYRGDDNYIMLNYWNNESASAMKERAQSVSSIKTSLPQDESPQSRVLHTVLKEIMPAKLAKGSNKIDQLVEQNDYEKIYYILRGGKPLYELTEPKIDNKADYLHPQDSKLLEGENCLLIDESIGTGNTLHNCLQTLDYSKIHFASPDSTLPPQIYKKRFPNVNFHLPEKALNIYGTRYFEDNPLMLNPTNVQKRFLSRISDLKTKTEKEINSMIDKATSLIAKV
jgi:hypothetical protein